MANFLTPPTYAEVILVDEKTKRGVFNPIWLNWFLQLTQVISSSGGSSGAIQHNSLAGLQGGGGGNFFHMTIGQNALVAGLNSNTYTPTLTNVTNISSSTPHVSQYMSIGSTVVVSGEVVVAATAAPANTLLGISLPIPSNFANTWECAGTGAFAGIAANVLADIVNDRAQLQWLSSVTSPLPMYYIFMYRII